MKERKKFSMAILRAEIVNDKELLFLLHHLKVRRRGHVYFSFRPFLMSSFAGDTPHCNGCCKF